MVVPVSDEPRPQASAPSRSEDPGQLRIDEVGQCLLVSVGHVSRRGSMVARTLPAEDGRIAVVVPDTVTVRIAELVDRLWQWVPAAWESVRLVMPNAALPVMPDAASPVMPGVAPPERGDRPVAQQLSEMLGVEVIAPSGRLLAVPDGSLFVVGNGRDAGNGVWSRFRPGRPVEVVGRRFPVPEWEPHLAGFADPGIAGVDVAEIPAGLWVRWAGKTSSTDLGFAVPVHPSNMALLISRAGDPPLRNADVRHLLQALPMALWDWITVVPYGDEPIAGARPGAVVAVATNRVVPVRTGLPVCRPGGGVQVAAVGSDDKPTWSPFAHTMAWPPHGGPRLLGWSAPVGHLIPVGPGQLRLNERWLVEVIEAGLWLREIDRPDGAAVVRRLPVRSEYCTVVVGGFDARPRPPWRAIVKLVQQLPGAARDRLRLAVPAIAGERLAKATARICRRKLRDSPVYVLTSDGELVRYTEATRQRSSRSGRETVPVEQAVPTDLEFRSRPDAPLRENAGDSRKVPAEGGLPRPPAPDLVPEVPLAEFPAEPDSLSPEELIRVSPIEPPVVPPAVSTLEGVVVSRRDEPADP